MRITLVTPLFPPDTGAPAPYIKELAGRLPSCKIDLLLYGHLPEYVSDIAYHCIDKRNIMPVRLFHFTKKLYTLAKQTDVLLVQNGPSVELPAIIISFVTRVPIVLCVSDTRARTKAQHTKVYAYVHKLLQKRVIKTICAIDQKETLLETIPVPVPRPEILPFETTPGSLEAYETSWDTHTQALLNVLHHATK